MMCIKNLLKAEKDKSIGNHALTIDGHFRKYSYHFTDICKANDAAKTVEFDCGGYFTTSTQRAIREYRRHYVDKLGYRDITCYTPNLRWLVCGEQTPIGLYCVCNFGGIEVLARFTETVRSYDGENYDDEETVKYRWNFGDAGSVHFSKIRYDENGRAYFKAGKMPVYLDEVMRV